MKGCFLTLSEGAKEMLKAKYSMDESSRALMGMGSFKAPDPDGFQPIFFKATWETTGEALYNFTREVLEEEDIPVEAAKVLLVLIPKEETPSTTRSFRPLSLCNVSKKVVSKMIVNRLKGVLSELISPNQALFVPDRQGSDNFIICQEVFTP